jgi:hypothetical protein
VTDLRAVLRQDIGSGSGAYSQRLTPVLQIATSDDDQLIPIALDATERSLRSDPLDPVSSPHRDL